MAVDTITRRVVIKVAGILKSLLSQIRWGYHLNIYAKKDLLKSSAVKTIFL